MILIYQRDKNAKGMQKILQDAIHWATGRIEGDDAEATHSAWYHEDVDLTFDTTWWQTPRKNGKPRPWWHLWAYRSGRRITRGKLPGYAYALDFKAPRTPEQREKGFQGDIARVNSRSNYGNALLLLDLLFMPTRPLWDWFYRIFHWAPFDGGSDAVCSMDCDRVAKDEGCDLWPEWPESLTVPGDFIQSSALQRVP